MTGEAPGLGPLLRRLRRALPVDRARSGSGGGIRPLGHPVSDRGADAVGHQPQGRPRGVGASVAGAESAVAGHLPGPKGRRHPVRTRRQAVPLPRSCGTRRRGARRGCRTRLIERVTGGIAARRKLTGLIEEINAGVDCGGKPWDDADAQHLLNSTARCAVRRPFGGLSWRRSRSKRVRCLRPHAPTASR